MLPMQFDLLPPRRNHIAPGVVEVGLSPTLQYPTTTSPGRASLPIARTSTVRALTTLSEPRPPTLETGSMAILHSRRSYLIMPIVIEI